MSEERTELNAAAEGSALDNQELDNVGQDNLNPDNTGNSDDGNIGQEGHEKDNTDNNNFYGAPESYDFSNIEYPEGISMDETLAKEFAPIGKKLGLSQEGANELAGLLIKYQQSQLADAPNKIAEFKKQEAAQTKLAYEKLLNDDKEIGSGDEAKRNAYIDTADVGYNSFASDELKVLLQSLSLDYHPAVIKHFYRLGKMCGNDKLTNTGSPSQEISAAQILYGNTTKNENN